jgi:hypothetical protein
MGKHLRASTETPPEYRYADRNYIGEGIIRCYICDEPLRDHDIMNPCAAGPYTHRSRHSDRGTRTRAKYQPKD